MTEEDVVKLLDRVKLHYQHFSINDSLFYEWLRILKEYSKEDVFNNLDKYLDKCEVKIPTVFDLKKGLTPISKKQKVKQDYIINCNLCGKEMRLSEYENRHFPKCSSISYLITIMKKQGINVEYKELEQLDDIKFQSVYEKYKDY